MFLGIDMFSGNFAMLPQYIPINNLSAISLSDGSYDHLYLSADTKKTAENIYDDWEFYTKINADFKDSMDGGNTGFSLKNTDTIIIKTRERGTMDWITIFTIPVYKLSDFNFVKEYLYSKSGVDYDFMIVSSIGGIQNSYEFADCHSFFDGICIADKDTFYKTIYNIESTRTKNDNSSVLTLLNHKYPIIVSNDMSNYETGTIAAAFLKIQNDDAVIGYESTKYIDEIMNWLTNKKAKILKLENGIAKMIRVTGNPTYSDGGHPNLTLINFEFVEIGDITETELYRSNLSDVEPNRW